MFRMGTEGDWSYVGADLELLGYIAFRVQMLKRQDSINASGKGGRVFPLCVSRLALWPTVSTT